LFFSRFSSSFFCSFLKACFCMAKELFLCVYLIHFRIWSLIFTAAGFPCSCLHNVYNPLHRAIFMQPFSMQFSTVLCYTFSSSLLWVCSKFYSWTPSVVFLIVCKTKFDTHVMQQVKL
jgi:hypothetical protein